MITDIQFKMEMEADGGICDQFVEEELS